MRERQEGRQAVNFGSCWEEGDGGEEERESYLQGHRQLWSLQAGPGAEMKGAFPDPEKQRRASGKARVSF